MRSLRRRMVRSFSNTEADRHYFYGDGGLGAPPFCCKFSRHTQQPTIAVADELGIVTLIQVASGVQDFLPQFLHFSLPNLQ